MTATSIHSDANQAAGAGKTLLVVKGLRKRFRVTTRLLKRKEVYVQAIDDVSFSLCAGETLGIVGESGCGKSTLARLLMNFISKDGGRVLLDD